MAVNTVSFVILLGHVVAEGWHLPTYPLVYVWSKRHCNNNPMISIDSEMEPKELAVYQNLIFVHTNVTNVEVRPVPKKH